MKIIDKYLLKTLMVPLSYCLIGFSMIYVVFDLFDHFSDFMEAKTSLFDIFKYYLFLFPSVLAFIVPISLLLSVLYALSTLTRSNELTAMRASGVSLYRLMMPLMGVGLVASLVVGGVNESIAPWSMYWTDQFIKIQGHEGETSVHSAFNIAYKNVTNHRIWWIGEFNTQNFDMKNVIVTQQREDGTDEYKIQAKEGRWLDGRWWLRDLSVQNYTKDGQPMGAPTFELNRELVDYTENPRVFMGEVKDPQFFSSLELLNYVRTRHLSDDRLARYMTDFQSRISMPWTCLIVMLLGIPFGVHTGRKGAFLGIVFALSLFFGFYAMINLCVALGKNQTLPPILAGWLPNIFFFVLGSIMVNRLR
jgi:lipopolysaccharide export system permease protein